MPSSNKKQTTVINCDTLINWTETVIWKKTEVLSSPGTNVTKLFLRPSKLERLQLASIFSRVYYLQLRQEPIGAPCRYSKCLIALLACGTSLKLIIIRNGLAYCSKATVTTKKFHCIYPRDQYHKTFSWSYLLFDRSKLEGLLSSVNSALD